MKFLFIVEDRFGVLFFPKFFDKKSKDGIFPGKLICVKRVSRSSKMDRVIKANIEKIDRVVIIADAENKSREDKRKEILQYIKKEDWPIVRIVLFDYEIEDWICYSLGIPVHDLKPSNVLKHEIKYRKRQLPKFAHKLDCTKLQKCCSFQDLVSALQN